MRISLLLRHTVRQSETMFVYRPAMDRRTVNLDMEHNS